MPAVKWVLTGLVLAVFAGVIAWSIIGVDVSARHSGSRDSQRDSRELLKQLNRDRRAASLQGVQDKLVGNESLIDYVRRHTVWVIDGADSFDLIPGSSATEMRFAGMRDGQILTTEIGCGVTLTTDGYVLTAAHCVLNETALVLSASPGNPVRASAGTVIWSGQAEHPPVDLVILRVPGLTHTHPVPVISPPTAGAEILCSGSGANGLCLAGGRIMNDSLTNDSCTIESPLLPGDSGGPCFLLDGGLVGVISTASIVDGKSRGTVICPDFRMFLKIAELDRQRTSGVAPTESTISTAGVLRMMQVDEELQSALAMLSGDP